MMQEKILRKLYNHKKNGEKNYSELTEGDKLELFFSDTAEKNRNYRIN